MITEDEVRSWLRERVEIDQVQVDQWMTMCEALEINDSESLGRQLAAAEGRPMSPSRAVQRELLQRGDYGSVPIIPRDRPVPAVPTAVGVAMKRDMALILLNSPIGPSVVRSLSVAPEDEIGFLIAWAAEHEGEATPHS